jgi:hypothetical protein
MAAAGHFILLRHYRVDVRALPAATVGSLARTCVDTTVDESIIISRRHRGGSATAAVGRACMRYGLTIPRTHDWFVRIAIATIALFALAGAAAAQNKNLAEGFSLLPKNARVVIMPTDIELFSISAGGVAEPKSDWTEAATRHFRAALLDKKKSLGVTTIELAEKDADEVAEVNTLHAAIARAISLHHFGPSYFNLPTKAGKLDWSLGDTVRPIRDRSGADYVLFTWIRDSYASGERVATMILLALVGVGVPGGSQVGYASLVDLNTGQVVWFNRLQRASGDLREPGKAVETLNTLLDNFPGTQK